MESFGYAGVEGRAGFAVVGMICAYLFDMNLVWFRKFARAVVFLVCESSRHLRRCAINILSIVPYYLAKEYIDVFGSVGWFNALFSSENDY